MGVYDSLPWNSPSHLSGGLFELSDLFNPRRGAIERALCSTLLMNKVSLGFVMYAWNSRGTIESNS
jgi:hypothetical protein